jgi:hypothetical protein
MVTQLAGGSRITDYISLGVIAQVFPRELVRECLAATGARTKRNRDLPNQVVVYYVIAMTLFMGVSCKEVLRILLEGIRWLCDGGQQVAVTGKSGISQARSRVGEQALARLHDQVVVPLATPRTRGAWYRRWRLTAIDGSTLDVPDTAANAAAFGRPKNGEGAGAFPQIRFVSLVERGTHVLFGTRMGPYGTGESTLARQVLPAVRPDMLLLADRLFYSYDLWRQAARTGAALLWRVQRRLRLPCEKRLADGSYLSRVYASEKDRKAGSNAVALRVIEYTLAGPAQPEEYYRLITNILDPLQAPAEELAALYPGRWKIETALDELKTHLRGSRIVLRSKQPELARQELYGLMMAHFAIRGLMHEAALKEDLDPDRLSFVHAVRVVRRKLPILAAIPPSGKASVS